MDPVEQRGVSFVVAIIGPRPTCRPIATAVDAVNQSGIKVSVLQGK